MKEMKNIEGLHYFIDNLSDEIQKARILKSGFWGIPVPKSKNRPFCISNDVSNKRQKKNWISITSWFGTPVLNRLAEYIKRILEVM